MDTDTTQQQEVSTKRALEADNDSASEAAKRPKMATGIVPDATVPGEKDVGISEYVSAELGTVQGIIKQRFTDFQVFEVDPEGKVCRLEDIGPPAPSVSLADGGQDLRAELETQRKEAADSSGELRRQRLDAERKERESLRAKRQEEAEKRKDGQPEEFKWNEESVNLSKETELVEIAGQRVRDELKVLWEQGPNGFEKPATREQDPNSAEPEASTSQRDTRGDRGRGRGRGGRGGRGGGRGDGRGGGQGRSNDNGDPRKVITDPIESKETRGRFHQVIREMFKGRLITETVDALTKQDTPKQGDSQEEGKEFTSSTTTTNAKSAPAALPSSIGLRWNPSPGARDGRSREEGSHARHPAEAALPPYLHFVMQKTNRDTQDAVTLLAKALGLGGPMASNSIAHLNKIASKEITIAGTKDKRGVTVQRVCLRRGKKTAEDVWKAINGVGREIEGGGGRGGRGGRGRGRGGHGGNFGGQRKTLLDAVSSRGDRGIRVGHFSYRSRPLYLGNLKGNRFVIVLRNVKVDDEEIVHRAIGVLRDQGFINYYGMQRFGTAALSSHHIGLPVIKSDFEEAIRLIMTPRADDAEEARIAKEDYMRGGDLRDAFNLMPKWSISERAILGKMMDQEKKLGTGSPRNDWQNYFAAIPKQLRTMYLHAYQSYIWNVMASERVKRFGATKPVVGDFVYDDEEQSQAAQAIENGGDEDAPEGGVLAEQDAEEAEAAPVTDGNAAERPTTSHKSGDLPKVKQLTDADLASGRWTIHDVLIPSFGYEVSLPEGHWISALHDELLAADGLTMEQLCDRKRPQELTLRGTYRKLLHRPSNVSHGFVKYTDTNLPLSQSDEDRLLGIEPVPETFPTIKEAEEYEALRQKQDEANGEQIDKPESFLALKVSFELGTSAYATMALRELTKVDTSAGHQKTLTESSEDQRFRGHTNHLGVTAKKGEKVNEIQGKARVWGATKSQESQGEAAATAGDEATASAAGGITTTVSDAFKREMAALKQRSEQEEGQGDAADQDWDNLANA